MSLTTIRIYGTDTLPASGGNMPLKTDIEAISGVDYSEFDILDIIPTIEMSGDESEYLNKNLMSYNDVRLMFEIKYNLTNRSQTAASINDIIPITVLKNTYHWIWFNDYYSDLPDDGSGAIPDTKVMGIAIRGVDIETLPESLLYKITIQCSKRDIE